MSSSFKLNKVARDEIKLSYRSRGVGYSSEETIKNIHITSDNTKLKVEADIKWTRRYQTYFELTEEGKNNIKISDRNCSCPAFWPTTWCKHIAWLVRFANEKYNIDDYFAIDLENRENRFWEQRQTFSTKKSIIKDQEDADYYDERDNDDQLFWDQEEKDLNMKKQMVEIEAAMSHHIVPISKIDLFEEILWPKLKEFRIVTDNVFYDIIKDNLAREEKTGLELLEDIKKLTPITITPSLQNTTGNSDRNMLKIKLYFDKRKNDIGIGLYKTKRLKNGALSAGREIKKNSYIYTKDPLFQVLSPFIDQWSSGYYNYQDERKTLNSDSSYFIKALLHCVSEKTHIIQEYHSNKDIFIKEQIGLFFLEIKKNKNNYTISGVIKFSDGKKYNIVKHEIYGNNEDFVAITDKEKSNLFFIKRRGLPTQLIQSLSKENIILSKKEFQNFTKTKTFENILWYCDIIDEKILQEIKNKQKIITQNTPKEVFLIEFDDQFKQIHFSLKFRYPQKKDNYDPTTSNNLNIYVSPEDSRNYIENLNGDLIERNKKEERNIIKNYLPSLMDHFNVEYPQQVTFQTQIDENTDKLFDRIDQLIEEWILIHYLQKTKKISSKTISVSVNIKSGIDRFDTQVEIKLWDEEIEDKSFLREALKTEKKSIQLKNGTTILLKQDLKEITNKLTDLWIDKNNINENSKISKYNIGTLWKMLDDIEKSKKKNKDTTDPKLTLEVAKEIIKLKKTLKNFSWLQKVKIPEQLNAELRAYQKTGFYRLCFLKKYNFWWILADDMGLWKTIQTITLLIREHINKKVKTPSIVICPTSLTYNRRDEFKKFSPELKTYRINDWNESFSKVPKDTDIIIVSYGIIANLINTWINKKFHYIILDESQHIKNPNTKRAKTIFKINGKYKLALSGTPIENNLLELRSIFNFLMPGFLGTQREFTSKYIKDTTNLPSLSAKIKPFILRRTKEKVLKDLPPKVEETIYLSMENKQESFYKELAKIYKISINKKLKEDWLNKARFKILDALLKLRQVCLMPALVNIEGNNITDSIKLKYIEENIEDMIGKGHNVLMFSQFTGFLKYLKEILDKKQIKYNYLDGQTRPKQRQELVKTFNKGEVNVFVISLKAGGTWLNLTRADYIIHLDPRWNPAVEMQATDRAHRIWQKKTVFVQKLIVKDSIEEKILKLQEKKKKLVDDIMSGDFSGKLNEDDIKNIFD